MKRHIVTALVVAFSIALIVVGIINNQQMQVLNKAVRICLECVGIG